MSRWWHYLLLGVVAWLAFLVVRLPAPVAYALLGDRLGGEVRLVGLSGTAWHGHVGQLNYRNRVLGGLDWRLSPWGMLLGRLNVDFSLRQGEGQLQGEGVLPLGGDEFALSRLEGRLPLSMLQPYLVMMPLPLAGEASLKLTGVTLDSTGRPQQAGGRIVWHRAGLLAPQPLSFGDLQMTLQPQEGGGIRGEIRDSGGPLQLEATLTLTAAGGYRLAGTVKARASATAELADALALLGKADSAGRYAISFNGTL